MLTDYFSASFTLARHRATPFGGYLDGFTEWLAQQGYIDAVVVQYVQSVTALGDWLPDSVASQMLDDDVLARYDAHLRRIGKLKHPAGRYSSFSSGARVFLKYLRAVGVAPLSRVQLSPLVEEFCGWMRAHRGAAAETVKAWSRYIQAMIEALGDPKRVTPSAIRTYLLRQADGRGRSYISNLCASTRSFFRFLISTGRCSAGLDAAIPRIARWRLAELPRFIHRPEVRRIVAAPDPETAHGLRDRAILTILADMGLRASDIGAITVDAIDWKARTLTVIGKGRIETRLPLPASVIRAIRAYLKHGRPEVDRSAVFLNLVAPYRPVSRQSVFYIVRTAIRRAGVEAPHDGPHMLRHSFAADLLRRGLSLDAIGARLRHRTLDATLTYAKVDATRLQRLAVAWPEATPC